jgi:hypothetical protein
MRDWILPLHPHLRTNNLAVSDAHKAVHGISPEMGRYGIAQQADACFRDLVRTLVALPYDRLGVAPTAHYDFVRLSV